LTDFLLITPPDKLHNSNVSVLFVCPDERVQRDAHEFFLNNEIGCNLYLYNNEHANVDWLLTIANMADICILDFDNSDDVVRHWFSYLLTLPNSYWFAKSDFYGFSQINEKRVYDFNIINF